MATHDAHNSTPHLSPEPSRGDWLAAASERMIESIGSIARIARLAVPAGASGLPASSQVPNIESVAEVVALARRLVFVGFFEKHPIEPAQVPGLVTQMTARLAAHLSEQVQIVLRYAYAVEGTGTDWTSSAGSDDHWAAWPKRLSRAGILAGALHEDLLDCELVAQRVTERFVGMLPEIRRMVALDVEAAFDGDPAAEHPDEIILCYPGLNAIFHHRIAHELYNLGVPLLPRIIAEQAHRLTGIDIHPGARIGERFFVDHGAGTVIGETSLIGRDVKIYQGVTLGAKSFERDEGGELVRGSKRHPTLGDRVTIYAGAVILGGDTLIGDDCVINGGVFVTTSVPPGHIVRQKQPELTLRSNPGLRKDAPRS